MTTSDRDNDVSTFLSYCRVYCDVNALRPNWESHFRDQIAGLKNRNLRDAFQRGFALAATGRAVSAREYELATGWDFDSEDEYREHLRALWSTFYGELDPNEVTE